jgi:hypothetical protein
MTDKILKIIAEIEKNGFVEVLYNGNVFSVSEVEDVNSEYILITDEDGEEKEVPVDSVDLI